MYRQTNKHAYHNTLHPCQGRSNSELDFEGSLDLDAGLFSRRLAMTCLVGICGAISVVC